MSFNEPFPDQVPDRVDGFRRVPPPAASSTAAKNDAPSDSRWATIAFSRGVEIHRRWHDAKPRQVVGQVERETSVPVSDWLAAPDDLAGRARASGSDGL